MTLATTETPISTRTNVPWDEYVRLRDEDGGHTRMTYHNGELIVMSPEYLHEYGSEFFSILIREIVIAFDLQYRATRTTTLKRRGKTPLRGSGKEPDLGYYFPPNEAKIRGKATINLELDPPPDLIIEVEIKADARLALPVLAALGVPEVWRFDAQTRRLRFDQLVAGSYQSVDRSVCLPMLTTAIVSEVLDAFDLELPQRDWEIVVHNWAARLASQAKGGES